MKLENADLGAISIASLDVPPLNARVSSPTPQRSSRPYNFAVLNGPASAFNGYARSFDSLMAYTRTQLTKLKTGTIVLMVI